jgi:hypothetical protein
LEGAEGCEETVGAEGEEEEAGLDTGRPALGTAPLGEAVGEEGDDGVEESPPLHPQRTLINNTEITSRHNPDFIPLSLS